MATTAESSFTLRDGLSVYTKTWTPASPPCAHVLLIHGFSDHINNYYALPSTLAERGIEVFAFDQRGWGRSAPNKSQWGASGGTVQLFADIDDVLAARLAAHPGLPLFLLGHSMGGGTVLTYAVRGSQREKLAGTIAWSPMLEFAPEAKPFPGLVAAGKMAAKVVPGMQMVQKLKPEYMCRDPQVCKDFEQDPLCHDTGTLAGIAAMLDRGKELTKTKKLDVDRPLLLLHGSGDKICSHKSTKTFAKGLEAKDKEYVEYDGWYHKLHAEPGEDKIKFSNDIAEWVLARVPGNRTSVGSSKL